MTRLHLALAALFVLGLAACGGPGNPSPAPTPDPTTPSPAPVPTPGPSTTANNSAVLSGDALGAGIVLNSQLRRAISVSSTAANTAFRLGNAYATRNGANSETLYWFISVTNQSPGLQCFIRASTLEFRDSTGQTLVTDDFTFVSGSVGANGASYTDTCLNSGETGYFFGIELEDETPLVYSSVSNIVIAAIGGDGGFSVPPARIIPQSYSPSLAVTVRNEGNGAARIGDFSHYFSLDEANLPLSWGYFDSSFDSLDDNPVLEAGDVHTLNEPLFLFYDGLSSKVLPHIDFVSPADLLSVGAPAFSTRAVNPDTAKKQYVARRSRLEQAKRETLKKLERNR